MLWWGGKSSAWLDESNPTSFLHLFASFCTPRHVYTCLIISSTSTTFSKDCSCHVFQGPKCPGAPSGPPHPALVAWRAAPAAREAAMLQEARFMGCKGKFSHQQGFFNHQPISTMKFSYWTYGINMGLTIFYLVMQISDFEIWIWWWLICYGAYLCLPGFKRGLLHILRY